MNEEELLKKLREAFKLESQERLSNISSSLLELEKASEPDKQEPVLDVVFREAHSLKGAARAVNLTDIEALFQSMEGIFAAIRRKEIPFSADLFDLLHSSVGGAENFLAAQNDDPSLSHREEIITLVEQLEQLINGKKEEIVEGISKQDHTRRGVGKKVRTKDTGKRYEGRGEKKEDSKKKRKYKTNKHNTEKKVPAEPEKEFPKTQLMKAKPLISESVRISTAKLDSILLKAEELVSLKLVSSQHLLNLRNALHSFENWKKRWTKAEPELRMLRNQVHKGSHLKKNGTNAASLKNLLGFVDWNQEQFGSLRQDIRVLTKASEQNLRSLSRMVDDLLDDMKKVTMLPFSSLLDTFPIMVRDISREQKKEVDLVLKGGEVEIDRRILEEMRDPLIHLLRNAIDHGLETPEQRIEQQKLPGGTIDLSVSQTEGKMVEILISDDGKGIDLIKAKEKAIKMGIISRKEAENFTDPETLSLIFRSHFSTSPIITQISGRGLGLAIVQESVEKLGGHIALETNPGKGSSFRIQVPVTLATFRGVLVKARDHFFILPSLHVERVSSIHRDQIQTAENRETISVSGRVLSLVELADVLRLPQVQNQEDQTAFVTVAVLGSGEKRIAFTVDEVLNEQEVLAKGLGKQLSRVPNIAGATILGSGKVVPILNVHDLLKSSLGVTADLHKSEAAEEGEEKRRKSVLVVEDSITSRTLIKNILETAGHYVRTAVDGQDAYTLLKTEGFDLVVSDVDMPRMNGFELTEKIRKDKRFSEIPVVLVTARESPEDRERGIDTGADAYIVKSSFDQSNLIEVIGRLI